MQRQLILLFLSLFLFSSCFEIIEEITIGDDGSGNFELTLNLSESKTKLSSIMLLDSIEGFRVPSRTQISNIISELVNHANETEGILNVKNNSDFENFIFTFSCDFQNVEALNSVVVNIEQVYGKNSKVSPDETHVSYNKDSKIFRRNGNYITAGEYEKMDPRGKEILEQAKYISINRFSNEIREFNNLKTKLSPNKKASMLKLSIAEIMKGQTSVGNELKLK